MSLTIPYTADEEASLEAVLAAANRWLHERGYGEREALQDEFDTLLNPETAPDALGMLGTWVARCDLPSQIVYPVLSLLVEKCRERLGDADDADMAGMLEIYREWIGHAETDADDSGRTVHGHLSAYALELAQACDPTYTDEG